ncbi:MAG: hypothetical protein IKY89_07240 [Alistipes sp.]|nr:hypothetical protein [Alistipes sp.]
MKTTKFLSLTAIAAMLAFTFVSCETPNVDEPNDEPNTEEPVKPESGKPVVMEDFTVTLTSLHSGDVFLTIEPEDKDMAYWYQLQVKEDMPETDEEILASDMEYLQYIADYYGTSLTQLLADNLLKGDLDWRYQYLEPNTEYVLYAYGMNISGEALTAVNQLTFKTTKVEQLDCEFDILVGDNVTANSFSITIIPSDDTVAYYYDVFPAWMYEEYCLSDAANIPAFMAEYIPALASENSVTVAYAVGAISNYGSIAHDFTLEDGIEANSSYFVFAIGIGADGTTTTEAEVIEVKTAAPPVNTFEVTEGYVEDDRATFYVRPNHSESYVALFELKEYFVENGELVSDEEIIAGILAAQGSKIGNHVYSGTSTVKDCPMIPNKDYYCLVFGYFGGEVTTPLTKVEFRTKAADMVDADIIVTVAEVTYTEASVSFQPYIEPFPHMFNVMPYATYEAYGANDEAIKRYNDELIDQMWDPAKMSREEWLSRALETTYNSWRISDLETNTKYLVYAIGLVPDGTYTTEAFTKTFTTKELKEGPQVEEVLYSKSGNDILAWFYFEQNSGVSKFVMSHLIDDDSIYNLSDAELLAYLEQPNETTYVNEVSNQTYFTVVDKAVPSGSTIYYAGAVYDSKGGCTIIRETYKKN